MCLCINCPVTYISSVCDRVQILYCVCLLCRGFSAPELYLFLLHCYKCFLNYTCYELVIANLEMTDADCQCELNTNQTS